MDNDERPLVVAAEPISAAGLELLGRSCRVEYAADVPRERLLELMGEARGLVVRSGVRVDRELIGAAPRLAVIGRAGVGLDNIDLEAAREAGAEVVSTPAANSISAAEHTMALMLAMCRHIPQADASIRAGAWERTRFWGVELYGKTLGVVGLGRIGTLVAERALAFGMSFLVYDPYLTEERVAGLGGELVELETLLSRSDFITIHIPLIEETRNLIGREALATVKPGVRIVNASRGGVLDEDALVEALRSGRVGGAALDVFASEPMTEGPLLDCPGIVVTPHLAASTVEAQDRVGEEVAQRMLEVLART